MHRNKTTSRFFKILTILLVAPAFSSFASEVPCDEDLLKALRTVDPDAFGKGRGIRVEMRLQDDTVFIPRNLCITDYFSAQVMI